MFPQLVAGPIIRFQEVDDQLRERTRTINKFTRGVTFIMLGMAKKICLADPCVKIADTTFASDARDRMPGWGLLAIPSSYFDFGLFGHGHRRFDVWLCLPENFDSPYHTVGHEFWRRWHLSLSTQPITSTFPGR